MRILQAHSVLSLWMKCTQSKVGSIDTCIEHDHERFSGFLKVSLEEVLIALRDDRHLLNDSLGMLSS